MKFYNNWISHQFLLIFLFVSSFGHSQDSTSYIHYPKKAAIWSLCLPGSGQIYNEIGYRKYADKKNRAWWKVPIIYGGLGTAGYYFYDNYSNAKMFKEEILFRRDNPGGVLHDELITFSSEEALINGYSNGFTTVPGFDEYARRRDLLVFAIGGIWLIQVIEAYVDAHFVMFDVSEDLSLSFFPRYYNRQNVVGLNVKLKF